MANNKNSLFSVAKTILSLKPSQEDENRLLKKGVPKSKINNATVIMESLVDKAVKGEVSAIKELITILDTDKELKTANLSKLYEALDNNDD